MAKKVLVVDDAMSVRQQVGLALTQAGFHVIEAVDGIDAQEKLRDDVSLVVCDVNMPRLGGLELLDKLHADAKWAAIPVVMLTTEMEQSQIERAKKAGAKGWMFKPFKAESLVAVAKKLAV